MTTLRLWSAASLAVAGFTATTTPGLSALADDARHPPVVVELRQCEQPLEAEVRRIVGVELRAAVIDAAASRDAVTRVVATCRDSAVDLSLDDAITAKRLVRTVALAQAAPTARPRLVALAVAELVAASWQEIQRGSESKGKALPPGEPPPEARVTDSARAEQASAMVEVIGVGRAFPGSGLWLLGVGARGFLTLSRPFTLTLDLTLEWGRTSRAPGQVAAQAIGGGLGVGWAVERRSAFIMPWLGVRAGVARLTGEPSPDSTGTAGEKQSGPCLGPELGVAATFFPHATVHATVALSAGAMLLGVRGEVVGDTNVNVLGPWAGMVIGVGLTKP